MATEKQARRRWLGLGAGLVATWLGFTMGRGTDASEPLMSRDPASCVSIDGLLACADEVPVDLAALCDRPELAGMRLRPGDRLSTSVCRLSAPRRDSSRWGRMAPAQLVALGIAVDPNTASAQELQSLPRIGPALARRVIEGRPYATAQELLRVKGIGPKTLAKIEPRLRLSPASRLPPRQGALARDE